MTTPITGDDPRYVSSSDRRVVLRAWAGADAAVDMGGWIDDDHEAFEAAVRHRLKDVANLARVQIVINDERGTIVVDHAPAPAGPCTCTDPAERARHRRRAKARASKCLTCRPRPTGYGEGKEGISACLGCGVLIGYHSCAPGYCVLCAHDPCWVKVS
jgi:hypothetical protein